MRVVVALGGNALLRRGEPLTAENQKANIARACAALAPLALEHELVIAHGNGPQVGLLALQGAAYAKVETYPLDVLDAETQGMIGYLIMQELGNLLPYEKPVATFLTMIEVDPDDPAFGNPTKPIGPIYTAEEADRLAGAKGWTFKPDGESMRRVVPSPRPRRIFGIEPVRWLLEHGSIVICAGGGGIPTIYTADPAPAGRRLTGVEAVIDKDLASALLAADLHADALLIVTDVDAVYSDWGAPQQHPIRQATPATLTGARFAEGSMGPKVRAACEFVERSGGFAAIGSIDDARALLEGTAGTHVAPHLEERAVGWRGTEMTATGTQTHSGRATGAIPS
jgi:carbamate kinase